MQTKAATLNGASLQRLWTVLWELLLIETELDDTFPARLLVCNFELSLRLREIRFSFSLSSQACSVLTSLSNSISSKKYPSSEPKVLIYTWIKLQY